MNLNDYEIETPHGWCDFSGVRKIEKRELFTITLENGMSLKATENHRLFSNGKEIYLGELKIGSLIDTKNGQYKILHISHEAGLHDVFDVVGITNEDSTYYTDDIISHNCSFSGSSNTLVDGNILSKLETHDPTWIPEEGFYVWKQPAPKRLYAFGVDVAKGAGNNTDYSVINIFDVTDFATTGAYEQVAMFRRNDMVLFDFIDKIWQIAKMFNNPMIVIENNTTGDVICKVLYNDKEYENLYFDYEKAEHGVNANMKTKPMALNFFKDDVQSGRMHIHSKDMLTELTYYEEVTPGIFKARPGGNLHDDTVSSAYWVSYALRSRYFQDDFMWYAGKAMANTEAKRPEAEQDEEILRSFNKYVKPFNEKDRFRSDLSR
jgi:hypothetical protein